MMTADLYETPRLRRPARVQAARKLPPPTDWPHVLDNMPARQLWLRGVPFPVISRVALAEGPPLERVRPAQVILGPRVMAFAYAVGPFPDPRARPVPLIDGWLLTGTTAIAPSPARRPRHMPVIQQRGRQSEEVLDELARLGVGLPLSAIERAALDEARPQTRADCASGPRPCPWVSCKHHLYLEVHPDTGSIKLNHPGKDVADLATSCALDVAEHGEATLPQIGQHLNLTMERIRQIIEGVQRQHGTQSPLDPREDD